LDFGSGGVDSGDIDQHDGDVVLDGVDPAADATFEALPVRVQNHRLLANRTDQYVEQILGNHTETIVVPLGEMLHDDVAIIPGQLLCR
jgi:hypothetical protein